ncbi:GyrI-like domain-containing protein [Myroides injenensis]|uniref:GyrI-like domain-containing protein n=1 Tax=Myroides injenensis TaxID=1183151 RepID=UPI000474BFB7
MKIIGLSVVTNNVDGNGMHDIGNLWKEFYEKGIMQLINNRVNDKVYSIYTDYESDYRGDYTTIIGVEVDSLMNIPEGMVARSFEGGEFLKFQAIGELPQAVGAKWQEIWQKNEELNRAYTYDYEVYGELENGVAIYIAQK